jgi:hypothetical protein
MQRDKKERRESSSAKFTTINKVAASQRLQFSNCRYQTKCQDDRRTLTVWIALLARQANKARLSWVHPGVPWWEFDELNKDLLRDGVLAISPPKPKDIRHVVLIKIVVCQRSRWSSGDYKSQHNTKGLREQSNSALRKQWSDGPPRFRKHR